MQGILYLVYPAFFIMSKKQIELNIIPMLHATNGVVVRPGQVCKVYDSSLAFMTGLGCDGKIYTNIKGETPMSEADMVLAGRSNSVVGYGCGMNKMKYLNGNITWTPTLLRDFFEVYKCSESPSALLDPMPVLYKKGGHIQLFNVFTNKLEYFSKVNKLELLINLHAACAWAGVNKLKYKVRLCNALCRYYIGWSSGMANNNIIHVSDTNVKKYHRFKSGWDPDDKLAILNSRIINLI